MKKFTLLFTIAFLFFCADAFGQAGTTITYVDRFGPLTLSYNGLVNGKHSYSESITGDEITLSWTGTRWEIVCCPGLGGILIAFSDASTVGIHPPSSDIDPDPWVVVDAATAFESATGSGTTTALPVELIDFMAIKVDRGLELQWQTSSELNNEKFQIEMSENGRRFKKIGEIKGSGTTQTQVDYKFLVKEPKAGITYYRLKQIDFDGQFEYSDMVSAEFEYKGVSAGTIYPNPSRSGLVSLDLTSEDSKTAPIAVFDATGKLITDQVRSLVQGNNRLDFDFSSLTAGIYILKIGTEQGPIQRKLILNK